MNSLEKSHPGDRPAALEGGLEIHQNCFAGIARVVVAGTCHGLNPGQQRGQPAVVLNGVVFQEDAERADGPPDIV